MKWRLSAAVTVAIAWMLTVGIMPAFASCSRIMKPQESFRVANTVVVGTVQAIGDRLLESNVQLKVQTYYKGQLGDTIIVLSDSGSQNYSPTTPNYKVGQKYLLYLTKIGATWTTSLCEGSHLLTNGLSPQEQYALGKGYSPQGPGTTLRSGSTRLFSVIILVVALYGFYQFQKKRIRKQRIDPPKND